jgi:predicted outer membrane protein
MRPLAAPAIVALLSLAGCSSSGAMHASALPLSSATVATSNLDDDEIASIARRIRLDQRVLAELSRSRGDDPAVRALGRRFAEDSSVVAFDAPASTPHGDSAVEDELAQRDIATELRLARFGGRYFDRAFLDSDTMLLEADVELLNAVLAPRAKNAALRARLLDLASVLSDELKALRALAPSVAQ